MAKILVVEDDEAILVGVVEVLELEDYEVLTAIDGVEGVEMATKHLPDLILCDIRMPRSNGYEVRDALQKNPATATIPLIFMTAKASEISLKQSDDDADYLSKPFTVDELLELVDQKLQS